MQKSLKLTIELVPSTAWNQNLRTILAADQWNTVRKQVYTACHDRCAICKATGKLHCHEIWQYDDVNHVQKLKGLTALCELCHAIKHIGYAGIQSSNGELDYETLIHHFMKINDCDRQAFQKHYEEVFELWEERCHFDWDLDVRVFI